MSGVGRDDPCRVATADRATVEDMRRHLAATFTLAVLSPFLAEFLLGDQYLSADRGVGAQVGMFLVLGLWYGTGAVLIREVARRTGRGWPTILLLGLAFGLIEEGLLTQTLFNPHYLGLDLLSYGHLGPLGIGLPWTIFVLTLHVVWSIATPIALVEGIWPGRDPWFGRIGLGVVIGLAVLGALAILGVSWSTSGGFLATPTQLGASALLAVVAVVVALRLPRVELVRPPRAVLLSAGVAVVLASAFQVTQHFGPDFLPAWLTVGVLVLLLAAAVAVSVRFRLDVLGLAIGAVLTYAWVGLTNAARADLTGVIEQIVIVLVALAVAVVAVVRRRRLAPSSGSGPVGTSQPAGTSNPVSANGSGADAGAHAKPQ